MQNICKQKILILYIEWLVNKWKNGHSKQPRPGKIDQYGINVGLKKEAAM